MESIKTIFLLIVKRSKNETLEAKEFIHPWKTYNAHQTIGIYVNLINLWGAKGHRRLSPQCIQVVGLHQNLEYGIQCQDHKRSC